MKSILYGCMAVLTLISCTMNGDASLGDHAFPLTKSFTVHIGVHISQISPADTWIAVLTSNSIVAIDGETHKELWRKKLREGNDLGGFVVIEDRLLYLSDAESFFIDRKGSQNDFTVAAAEGQTNSGRVLATYPDYIYIIHVIKGKWFLEGYDIATNALLWKIEVTREISNALYNESKDIVYILTPASIQAFENSTGKFLWEIQGNLGSSTLEGNILYLEEVTDDPSNYRIKAINLENQMQLWESDTTIPGGGSLGSLAINDQWLTAYGQQGILVIDKATGKSFWHTDIDDEVSVPPVYLNGIFYVKGIVSHAVYALAGENGAVLGYVKLEDTYVFDTLSLAEGVYALNNELIFYTNDSVIFYE